MCRRRRIVLGFWCYASMCSLPTVERALWCCNVCEEDSLERLRRGQTNSDGGVVSLTRDRVLT